MRLLRSKNKREHFDSAGNRMSCGFTLTEMLVTTLILALASALMATGIPAAIDTYQKTVKCADAQMALSTTVTALRSELGLATKVVVGDGRVYCFHPNQGWVSIGKSSSDGRGLEKLFLKGVPSDVDEVTVLDVAGLPSDGSTPLVAESNIPEGMEVQFSCGAGSGGEVRVRLSVIDTGTTSPEYASTSDDGSMYCILTPFAD